MVARMHIVPVLLPFPIWKRWLLGDTREQWMPDWYGERAVDGSDAMARTLTQPRMRLSSHGETPTHTITQH